MELQIAALGARDLHDEGERVLEERRDVLTLRELEEAPVKVTLDADPVSFGHRRRC